MSIETPPRFAAEIAASCVPCPACRDHGPHDDDGMPGLDRTFWCRACGERFEADEAIAVLDDE